MIGETLMSKDFWGGVTKDGKPLTEEEKMEFLSGFEKMILTSPEFAKIFFNTQVYNEIVNGVTTRGGHSEGVAIVAERLAELKAQKDGKSELEAKVSGKLARLFGYMHDLGHTPFGHDGEGALGTEMERFDFNPEYAQKRLALFGPDYVKAADDAHAETMCYEHNETSSIIAAQLLERFRSEFGYEISPESVQYLKTAILAHSTSRVKAEPDGPEQKAVRLADKVAYIPQDLLDLVKQGVLHVDVDPAKSDLSLEEQTLLGIDEETGKQLSELDRLPGPIREGLFRKLDGNVRVVQSKVAEKCFVEREDGTVDLDGRKETIDVIANYVLKGKTPEYPVKRTLTQEELKGADLFEAMHDAQKGRRKVGFDKDKNEPIYEEITDPEEKKDAINRTTEEYKKYLIDTMGLDPTMALLWTTKAKYQDAFIEGTLTRNQPGKDPETLGDINQRDEQAWKMKTTFQFFYSNPDQIPKEFRDKYRSGDGSQYTEQQIVSAYIASFTNKGLNELYESLVDAKLALSREEVIEQLKQARPDLDVDQLLKKPLKWKDPQNPKAKYKVSVNDVLEQAYEENVGRPIVAGKNKNPDREIPSVRHADVVHRHIESLATKEVDRNPEILDSTIDVSKTEVTSKDIKDIVARVREMEQDKEIGPHIDEAKKDEGGR